MSHLMQGCLVPIAAALALLNVAGPVFARIQPPVKGKRYTLTKQHGPWMIMVTTVSGKTTAEYRRARQGADDLVFELRQKGIPAYVYEQKAIIERTDAIDREGRPGRKIYAAQRPELAILAGNYDSADNKVAHKTLEFIKRFRPKVLATHALLLDAVSNQINEKFGDETGFKGKSQYGPLYKAFIAPNPLLSPQELAAAKKDPLLRKLNLGEENSIAENKGRYTLVVATFEGKSTIKPTGYALDQLDGAIKSGSLDQAGLQARVLARTMRAQRTQRAPQGVPAYVLHDKFRSVVTVGSFNSPDDPAIKEWTDLFKAKYRRNDTTKRDVLVSESFQIPGDVPGGPPQAVWVMDPQPQLIPVPRIR